MTAVVSQEAMNKARAMFPAKVPETAPSNGNGRKIDVVAYLEHYGRRVVKTVPHGTATLYGLDACVFDQSHTANEAAIGQDQNGSLFYRCFHNSCQDRTWHEAREKISGNDSLARFMTGGSMITKGQPDSANNRVDPVKDISSTTVEKMDLEEILKTSVVEVAQFLKADIPEQPYIVDPILRAGTLLLIYAPRGVGKTWFCLILALAMTRKMTIGPWTVTNPKGVLYIDGEMASYELQSRLKNLSASLPAPEAHFYILSSDWMLKNGCAAPNIANAEWREAIYSVAAKYRKLLGVLILDNLSSLTPGTSENDQIDWDPINQWLLRLRALDMAVIMVHHAGKGGDQRGTSKREDNIDVTVKLSRPAGYQPEDGAHFEVELTKARGVYGESAAPFALQIVDVDGRLTWTTETTKKSLKDVIIAMIGNGIPQKDISDILGKAKSYVSKVKVSAIKDNILTRTGDFTEKGKLHYGDIDIEKFTK